MYTLKLSVLYVACCNSILVFQGLILRLHDVPNSSLDVPNMYLCVFGAIVEAMLIKIVFFYGGNERFLTFFYIDVNFTII